MRELPATPCIYWKRNWRRGVRIELTIGVLQTAALLRLGSPNLPEDEWGTEDRCSRGLIPRFAETPPHKPRQFGLDIGFR